MCILRGYACECSLLPLDGAQVWLLTIDGEIFPGLSGAASKCSQQEEMLAASHPAAELGASAPHESAGGRRGERGRGGGRGRGRHRLLRVALV